MAYDADLADRVREQMVDDSPVTEQKMFGALAFLVAGKIAVAASSQGGLMVRVDPARADRLVATTNARPMEMKGRVIQGWLHVDSDNLRTEHQLAQWITVGTATVRSAPPRGQIKSDDEHPRPGEGLADSDAQKGASAHRATRSR